MKKLIAGIVGLAIAIAVMSCGGDGSPKSFTATGRSVQNLQRFSFLSMANSGLEFRGFGGIGSGGGTTGGATGGTGGGFGFGAFGLSSIGGFVRHFGGPNGIGPAMLLHSSAAGTTGGTGSGTGGTGGGGGTGNEDFYYDEWLQLWVDTQWTNTSFTSLFYLDEAKTQPAGHATSTFAGDWSVFPQTYSSDYAFTAGTLAGAHGTYNCIQTTMSEGSMVYNNTYADASHDQGSASWSETGSTWQSEYDGPPGTGWFKDSGAWNADGSGAYTCSSSDGWASTWHYNADGSGSAHFEGPDPKLPADLVWTAAGNFKITYADGTTEEWTWDDLWASGGGGGTTGSGGIVVAPQVSAPAPPAAKPEAGKPVSK
ncbi:MAG: hypothetical protein ACHQ50_07830 [Fimbriimonadales bacterium]